ncbi:MAG: hypothetical protein IKU34_08890 [Clostridia bacterium]|nr:hypothetical protein [Clostridia bacterium]
MEDLLSLVVIILYFVISASASKKKKEKKRQKRQAQSRRVQFEQAFEQVMEQVQKSAEKARQPHQAAAPTAPAVPSMGRGEGEDPCHEGMLGEERASMHVRAVTQSQMAVAAEGEDPCHTGSAVLEMDDLEPSPIVRSPIFNTEDPDEFARDVMRGVIMSEILNRPGARRGFTGMKRGA